MIVGYGGSGNYGNGSNGLNSTFDAIVGIGGGGGGGVTTGLYGGCGGGGRGLTDGGIGSQGYSGGIGNSTVNNGGGGGGGGMGSVGKTCTVSGVAGYGGSGIVSTILGSTNYYAGGGGGAKYVNGSIGLGIHGGGNGGNNTSLLPTPGTPNTGGGGGGSERLAPARGTNGGSGIVILRYPLATTNICPVKIPAIAQYRTWEWENSSLLYTNLIAWYPFTGTGSTYVGANAGSNAVDYSVSNSPATVFVGTSSGATWVAQSGPTSSYYSFDGGDYIEPYNLNFTSIYKFSICVWTLNTVPALYNGVAQLKLNSLDCVLLQNPGHAYGTIAFGGANGGTSIRGAQTLTYTPYPTNKWMFVCLTYNGTYFNNTTNFTIYRDGSKITTVSAGSLGILVVPPNKIGAYKRTGASMAGMVGFLDDFRVYNTELSALQVTNIFNATKASHPNPLWP